MIQTTETTDGAGGLAARVVRLADLPGVACPCGEARRAFADLADAPASLHLTRIAVDARTHYHRHHTEIYYVLSVDSDGPAVIELDGVATPVSAGDAILIPPGVRHRAVGRLTILNFVVPPFDPADEFFD